MHENESGHAPNRSKNGDEIEAGNQTQAKTNPKTPNASACARNAPVRSVRLSNVVDGGVKHPVRGRVGEVDRLARLETEAHQPARVRDLLAGELRRGDVVALHKEDAHDVGAHEALNVALQDRRHAQRVGLHRRDLGDLDELFKRGVLEGRVLALQEGQVLLRGSNGRLGRVPLACAACTMDVQACTRRIEERGDRERRGVDREKDGARSVQGLEQNMRSEKK